MKYTIKRKSPKSIQDIVKGVLSGVVVSAGLVGILSATGCGDNQRNIGRPDHVQYLTCEDSAEESEAMLIKKHSGEKIKETLYRLSSKYGINIGVNIADQSVVDSGNSSFRVSSFYNPFGMDFCSDDKCKICEINDSKKWPHFGSMNIQGELFLDQIVIEGSNSTLTRGDLCLVHEYGHGKAYHLADGLISNTSELSNPTCVTFIGLWETAERLEITSTFKEGDLVVGDPKAGHPGDNPDELYASAFTIAELGLIPNYEAKYKFSGEKLETARAIFEVVQRKDK